MVRVKNKGNYIISLIMLILSQPCMKIHFNLATEVFEVLKLKICKKFTGVHPCRSVISIKLLCNFHGIKLWDECFPVYLLHIFRNPFRKGGFPEGSICQLYPIQASQKMNPDLTHPHTPNWSLFLFS